MIITPPPKLVQCEPVAFSWEGGQGPFSALIRGLVKDGSEHWVHSFEHVAVGNASLAWIVDFPVGSEIEISITVRLQPQSICLITELALPAE